jgi:hypothetical protein
MESTDRVNSIAVDSAVAFIDGLQTVQSQAYQLSEAWLHSLAESQRIGYNLAKSLVKQSVEAQNAWRRYATESVKDLNGQFEAKVAPKAATKA